MALVSYEYSDSSDVEEDSSSVTFATTAAFNNGKTSVNKDEIQELKNCETSSSASNLFCLLPQPTNRKLTVSEEDDEFLHKKENDNIVKPKAKISVPSLSDKKSGLLSMLPQPKNGISTKTSNIFVPHVLTQKTRKAIKINETQNKYVTKKIVKNAKTNESIFQEFSDDSDDDIQNDFFSMKKTEEPSTVSVEDINEEPESARIITTVSENSNNTYDLNNYLKQDMDHEYSVSDTYEADSCLRGYKETSASHEINFNVETNTNESVLDDEAILKLCGSRGKRKREDIQIVHVNQREVLADAREWLVKGLMDDTTKRVSVSKKRGGEPTTQQKRKHQITYLAHQAKANEAELQNQWANNRMSKRQTQSKYGF